MTKCSAEADRRSHPKTLGRVPGAESRVIEESSLQCAAAAEPVRDCGDHSEFEGRQTMMLGDPGYPLTGASEVGTTSSNYSALAAKQCFHFLHVRPKWFQPPHGPLRQLGSKGLAIHLRPRMLPSPADDASASDRLGESCGIRLATARRRPFGHAKKHIRCTLQPAADGG